MSDRTAFLLRLASYLPRNALLSVYIMIGCAPPEAGLEGTSWANWIGIKILQYPPWVMQLILDRGLVPVVQDHDPEKIAEPWRKTLKPVGEKDREPHNMVDTWRQNYK